MLVKISLKRNEFLKGCGVFNSVSGAEPVLARPRGLAGQALPRNPEVAGSNMAWSRRLFGMLALVPDRDREGESLKRGWIFKKKKEVCRFGLQSLFHFLFGIRTNNPLIMGQ